ncbi:MAG: glycosyltransferase, partial [Angustibacter sp.]
MTEDGGRLTGLFVLGTSTGGVARHVLELTESLQALGHTITVAAPSSVGESFAFASAGAEFQAVEIRDRPHPRSDMQVVSQLRGLADDQDVVHAHGLRAGGLAVMALRRREVPLVVTLHNALLAEGVAGSPIRAAYLVLERLVARRADMVLGVCDELTQRLRQLGAKRTATAVVPAPSALVPSATPEDTRAGLDLGETPVVLCIARLAEQKGLPLLLDAMQLLQQQPPDLPLGTPPAVCLIAGDGPLAKRLAARISAEKLPVRLLGWRSDVADLLSIADVVVSAAVW